MKKILVVDDNTQNQYMLEVLLTSNGYEVEVASNGNEALEKAHKETPLMVISDILMPGMDGFSLCRAWKSDPALRGSPFIFYTATYIDPRDEKLAMELGAERFIIKPLEPDAFLAAMEEVLRDHGKVKKVAAKEPIHSDEVFYKEYNAALVRKLEDKMAQLQRTNRRLSSLYKASSELLSTRSSSELVRIILDVIVKSAGYQQANYFSYDESSRMLVLEGIAGYSDDSFAEMKEKLVFNLGEKRGIVGKVAAGGHLLNLADTSSDPNWISYDPLIKSALFVPMFFESKLLGLLALFANEENAFSEEDCNDITALANNLAIAIINDRNEKRVQKQLSRISSLHNIDTAINSSLDLRNMLDLFLKQALTQLKMDAGDVLLGNNLDVKCEIAAGRGFKTHREELFPFPVDRNLAKRVFVERAVVQVTDFEKESVNPEFVKMWEHEGFSTYIGVPLVAKGEVLGALEVFNRDPFTPDEEWLSFLSTLAGQAAIAVDKWQIFEGLQRSNLELSLAYDATIQGWSRALDMRDQETEGHTQRVTEMTTRLAEIMGLTGEDIVHIRRGALLHDIGKLSVPDAILLKHGELTPEEMAIMRRHAQAAYDLIHPIKYLQPALDIPFCHHEKWDGKGYPRGLKGTEIPLAARLFAVVDVYDALRSERPYRKPWPEEEVLTYIRDQSGLQFDPEIVEIFLKMISER
jgi:response regulator RpfG family c-di-GMP phosphodiesterase